MPAKTVTTHLDTVLTAEISNLVGTLKVPHAFLRMNLTGLPVVLGSHTVELLEDECLLCIITHIALVQRYTNGKITLVGIFQSYILSGINLTPLCKCTRTSRHSQDQSDKKLLDHFNISIFQFFNSYLNRLRAI